MRLPPSLRIVACVIALTAVVGFHGVAVAFSPHGEFSPDTARCGLCHVPHEAAGPSQTVAETERALCLSCHDGSGSTVDIWREFNEGTGSSHPVESDVLRCGSCHTPHEGPAEGNPSSLRPGETTATAGIAVCAACHGSGSSLAGGDLAGPITGTPHADVVPSDSPAGIGCRGCHAPHASANASLIRTQVRSSVGETVTVNGEPSLCLACHQSSASLYSGGAVAAAQRHTTVTSSTRALSSWPGSAGEPGGCDGCHEPHGLGSGGRYTREAGDALCETCHAADTLTYPVDYSYRGDATFSSSGHNDIVGPAIEYLTIVADGAEFSAWASASVPSPSEPGTPVSPNEIGKLALCDGERLITALQTVDGSYDHQMYRFTMPVVKSDVISVRVHWEGYGEEAPGFPVVISVWVPATGSWEQLRSAQMVNQTMVNLPLRPADHIADDGAVYLMAKARYSFDENVISGPTVTALSGTSARVDWVTSGLTDSWVDYGSTAAYGSTVGSATRTQSHSVTVAGLAPGVWHFRARSVAADGGTYASSDIEQGIPGPTRTAEIDYAWMGTDPTVTLEWAAPALAPGGPFEMRMHLQKDGVSYVTTGWGSETSYTAVMGLGSYTWRVEARDAAGHWYGYSPWDTFFIYDNTGTCPYLYTWDGEKYAFEADLYGPGKLALRTKTGFARPTPDDVYVLANEPAIKDGLLDLRLVEERFEADYLDELKLYTVDAPASRDVYAEKREAGGAPFPGVDSVLHTVSTSMATPRAAVHMETGDDVRSLIAADDESYVVLSEDRNTDFDYQTIELDLGDVIGAPQVKLVMDAVSMYPSNAEGAARAATFGPRTRLEVQDTNGAWVTVAAASGALPKAPEFSRPFVFDISNIWASDSRKVRLTFLFKTYVDWIAVDTTADLPVTVTEVPLVSADLSVRGFSAQSSTDEIYEYVYAENTGRTAYLPGNYTRLGVVTELLEETDDRFVVYGGGDEIALSFQPPTPAGSGVTRRYAVHTNGYYKDLKSDTEHVVDALPFAAMSNYPYGSDESYPTDEVHTRYLAEWNTRFEGQLSDEITVSEVAAPGAWDRFVGALGSFVEWAVGVVSPDEAVLAAAEDSPDAAHVHRSLNTDIVALEVTTSGDAPEGQCAACHAPHGAMEGGVLLTGGRAASDGRTCTGSGGGACHSSAANSASGVNVHTAFTAGVDARYRHDVMPADQLATGGRTACADCHNPHRDNETVRYADPDDISATVASGLESLIATDGALFLLVGGDHDGSPPTISSINLVATVATNTSPIVTWTTNERSTSWIDWGTTTDYELGNESVGTPFGNDTPVTSHSVSMSGLEIGTLYHYRVRSADALGNSATSADRLYKAVNAPPPPVMNAVPDQTGPGSGPILVTVSSSAVSAPDGNPVQYQYQILGGTSSSWMSSPSASLYFYDGTYQVRVRARDSVWTYAVSGWSDTVSFTVTNAPDSGSCPFLFTWDGAKFVFEADLFGSGKLATRTKTGYLPPVPQDPYLLETTPARIDGSYEFRLVEERYETDYLDELRLHTIDVPEGYDVYAEKYQAGGAAYPGLTGALHTVRLPLGSALGATHVQSGEDVTGLLAARDGDRLVLNEDRNDGFEYQTIELDLGDIADAPRTTIVMDAISLFPTTDEGAVQASKFGARTRIEVQDATGAWVQVPAGTMMLPKPPEFSRPYAFDVSGIWLSDSRRVRMTFLFKTLVDWIAVDTSQAVAVSIGEVPLISAELRAKGMDLKEGTPEVYEYVYGEPNDRTAYFEGYHTRFGEVAPLLEQTDDLFVIFGGGDELALRYDAEAEREVSEGFSRRYLMFTQGYYKDAKVGLSETVEPLPFNDMSTYPYPETEQYPGDELHNAYRAEWNTRYEAGVYAVSVARVTESSTRGEIAWRVYHTDVWATGAVVGPDVYSIDTDHVLVAAEAYDGTVTTIGPTAGWESQSAATSLPTPASPGDPVDAAVLAAILADDSVYWSTDLAVADRNWNWQVIRYDLGASALTGTKGLSLSWNGHGEPTTTYNTAVYVWSPVTNSWTLLRRADMRTDTTVGTSGQAVASTFCLRCHDGTPPEGVVFPPGVVNVGPSWTNATTGDFHGARAGSGFGSTLKKPNARGQGAIPCVTCHDTHGTGSLYHFPSSVNGAAVPAITTGNWTALCSSCHEGTVRAMHEGCATACHYGEVDHYDDITYLLPNESSSCASCHKHGTAWTHPTNACGHCHISLTYARTM
ncbi:MAG: cytochrome c3 family protein [Coriobacteriia bacterium]|nr:cytochrome c3 family protein [Coriobacteriia bacterium]